MWTHLLRRLCETYVAGSGAALSSPTFAQGLDPQWPLCPFETAPRGSCHSATCRYQMTVDCWLPAALVAEDIARLANRCGHRGPYAPHNAVAFISKCIKARCSAMYIWLFALSRAGGSCTAPKTPKLDDLPSFAAAALSAPGVQRNILLRPAKQVAVRHHRAVPPTARQAAIHAPVPAYVR